jgi:hypothetical protein
MQQVEEVGRFDQVIDGRRETAVWWVTVEDDIPGDTGMVTVEAGDEDERKCTQTGNSPPLAIAQQLFLEILRERRPPRR